MKLCTRSFILRGTCRIIPRAAAAIMRIATRPKSSTSTAISTRGAGKTGTTSSSLGRLSAIGIIPMAETTSALHHSTASTRLTPCSASPWEAAYEIRRSEWLDTQPAVFLRVVLRTDRRELPKRAYNASLLLRSRVLRGPRRVVVQSVPRPSMPGRARKVRELDNLLASSLNQLHARLARDNAEDTPIIGDLALSHFVEQRTSPPSGRQSLHNGEFSRGRFMLRVSSSSRSTPIPNLFVWTARPNRILAAVKRGNEKLESIH